MERHVQLFWRLDVFVLEKHQDSKTLRHQDTEKLGLANPPFLWICQSRESELLP
jgi:hypothetical protein